MVLLDVGPPMHPHLALAARGAADFFLSRVSMRWWWVGGWVGAAGGWAISALATLHPPSFTRPPTPTNSLPTPPTHPTHKPTQLLYRMKDESGLVFFGTTNTSNQLNEEQGEGQYECIMGG